MTESLTNRRPSPRSMLRIPDAHMLQGFLAGAHVDVAVFAVRPDSQAVPSALGGIVSGPIDQVSDALLRTAEETAREARRDGPVEELPHVGAWREAYGPSSASRSERGTFWRRRSCAAWDPVCPE